MLIMPCWRHGNTNSVPVHEQWTMNFGLKAMTLCGSLGPAAGTAGARSYVTSYSAPSQTPPPHGPATGDRPRLQGVDRPQATGSANGFITKHGTDYTCRSPPVRSWPCNGRLPWFDVEAIYPLSPLFRSRHCIASWLCFDLVSIRPLPPPVR